MCTAASRRIEEHVDVRHEASHSEVSYVWPQSMLHPGRPPKLVFLDLNHWIGLAKARTGHAGGEAARRGLAVCSAARAEGAALFPISGTTIMELSKVRRYRQRRDLRQVIEELSGYFTVAARDLILRHEIDAVLNQVVGPRPDAVRPLNYLDWGVARSIGIDGSLRVHNERGEDVTAQARADWVGGPEAFDRTVADAQWGLQQDVIDGPTSAEEEEELRALGWDPRGSTDVDSVRLAQEQAQAARFAEHPSWLSGRLRDAVAAWELIVECNEMLTEAMTAHRVELETAIPGPNRAREVFDAMPSLDVSITLKTAYHRNPHHRWTVNDIHDIDTLAASVPYCDIVLADKAAAHHLSTGGVGARCDTVILAKLSDLEHHL
jgi:hypothetical protein